MTGSEVVTGKAVEWKKYFSYDLKTDHTQDDKANEINLLGFKRPHMRAFHCSWLSSFIGFYIWYALVPLLEDVKKSLNLTKEEIWTSSICSVAGTIFMHLVNGPICDKYGARIPMGITLILISVTTSFIGFIKNSTQLSVLRFFIGFSGSTFVLSQSWTSAMFTKETSGTANALVGGWGSLGTGASQISMGSVLFPLFKAKMNPELAWRTVCLVPAAVSLAFGFTILNLCDDSPKGNYAELKKHGLMRDVSTMHSFYKAFLNVDTWLLSIQYACCFGVELTMNNAAALYFREEFGQSTESAAAIASIIGWTNIFARGVGGFCSDNSNARCGMRGRLLVQTIFLAVAGVLVLIFASTKSLGLSIVILVILSSFTQAAEGSIYGIVPYVDPRVTGSVAGIIGAGGNVGAVWFGLGFRNLKYNDAFVLMGSTTLASSVLSVLIFVQGHAGLMVGEDSQEMRARWMNTRNGAYGMINEDLITKTTATEKA